jgi:hypothetical protein
MPDCVDTQVDAVKAAGCHPAVNPPAAETDRQELAARDDAMLTRGERGDLAVTWSIWFTHSVVEIDQVVHGVHLRTPRRTGQPGTV